MNNINKTNLARKNYDKYIECLIGKFLGKQLSNPNAKEIKLIPTCLAILILEGFRKLDHFSNEEKNGFVQCIQNYQDSETGFFKDGPALDHKAENKKNEPAVYSYEATYLALQAMDSLGIKARYPLRFMESYVREDYILRYITCLDKSNFPTEAHNLMQILFFLVYRSEIEMDQTSPSVFHKILDFLDRKQDPKTGLWGINQEIDMRAAIEIAYKFVPFYEYVNRPIKHIRQIIDSILRKTRFGEMIISASRSALLDLSAIDLLSTFTKKISHRNDEIKEILIKSYWTLRNQMDLSSSAFFDRNDNKGDDLLAKQKKTDLGYVKGSLFDFWLRLLSIGTLEHLYPFQLPNTGYSKFRVWPSIGYHRFTDKLSDHQRKFLPVWVRQSNFPSARYSYGSGKTPPISVIIPCFNLGPYLHDTVESVLAQTLKNFEVVIVNDGSTDEFTNLLLENFDRPKTKIIHQSNQGLATSRNNGIRESKGKYICCLDADDLIRPRFFEKALPILENNPKVGFVTGYMHEFDDRDEIRRYERCNFPELLVYNHVIVPALFRREAWEKAGGYYDGFITSGIEDWDLWISIVESEYTGSIIPEVLYDYRIRPDSMAARMNLPVYWGTLIEQLVMRHKTTYEEYLVEAMSGSAIEFAKLLQWTIDREHAIHWWEGQAGNWKELAERGQANFASTITKLQRQFWIRLGLKFGLLEKKLIYPD